MNSGGTKAVGRIGRISLPVAVVAALLLASNFGLLVYSALNHGEQRFESVTFSFEFAASLLLILVGILEFRVIRTIKLNCIFACFTALAVFILFNVVSHLLVHGDPRRSVTFVGVFLVFNAAYLIGRNSMQSLSLQLPRLLWIFPFLTSLFLLVFYMDGRLELPFGILKPQIRGGVRSTELSLIVGLQLVYCFFVMNRIKQHDSFIRYANAVLIGVALLMIVWFASIAAIGALLALYLLYQVMVGHLLTRTVKIVTFGAVLLIATSTVVDVNIGDIFVGQIAYKVAALGEGDEGSRTAIYAELIGHAATNPTFGIGLGSFSQVSTTGWLGRTTHPHQNILGLAAETGILSAFMYLIFVVAIAYTGTRTVAILNARNGLVPSYARPVALLSLGAFLYLQIRGLAQDTWQMKEVYLWAGMVVGCYSHCRCWKTLPVVGQMCKNADKNLIIDRN